MKVTVNAMERNEIDAAVVGFDADQEEIEALSEGEGRRVGDAEPFRDGICHDHSGG